MSGAEPRRSQRLRGPAAGAAAAAAAPAGGSSQGPSSEASSEAPPSVATPSTASAKRRAPPQDIGIPQLLLLGGGQAAAAGADEVDAAPLGAVGFTPDSLRAGCEFLRQADPKLAPLIDALGPPDRLLRKGGSNFATLAKAIIFQQLATKAAATIYGRVLAACGCADVLTPEAVLAAPLPSLRGAGLSERKASYILDLAAHFADGRLSDARIEGLGEAELERELTAIRGIGVWTVQMHAMFHLGSPDVLPTGDLGVRKGMQHLYGLKDLPSPAKMHEVAAAWRPYASLGSYFMWKVDAPRAGSGGSSKKRKAK